MKGDPLVRLDFAVVRAQPVDELAHFAVAPHPRGKTRECDPLRWRVLGVTNVVVDASRIRPISFDGDERKALAGDELA
jgi:hypothetical protein